MSEPFWSNQGIAQGAGRRIGANIITAYFSNDYETSLCPHFFPTICWQLLNNGTEPSVYYWLPKTIFNLIRIASHAKRGDTNTSRKFIN